MIGSRNSQLVYAAVDHLVDYNIELNTVCKHTQTLDSLTVNTCVIFEIFDNRQPPGSVGIDLINDVGYGF